ncbi:MAG: NAD(+)/NADH kinase [Acidobacteriota bacterium]
MKHGDRIRTVGLIAKPTPRSSNTTVDRIVRILRRHRIQVLTDVPSVRGPSITCGLDRADVVRGADVVIVVGGDGTFLAAARQVGPTGPPLVGINLGTLGFLTEARRAEMDSAIETVVKGQATLERRLMLSITVNRRGGQRTRYRALNDVVITNARLARLVDLQIDIDSRPINNYRSDGLIIATPTGSTAYSLSAGGPLVHPGIAAILITPICPHALGNRPLVVPSHARVTVRRLSRREPVQITVDGQVGGPFNEGDRMEIRRNRFALRLLRPFPRTFYDTLKTKLKWG